MKRIAQVYIKGENIITNVLMIGVVIFVFFAAVMRWVGYPIAWSVEVAQLLFIWVIFLGANRALREGKHIGVDFFTKRFPEKLRLVVELINILLILFFLFFVGAFGVQLSIENAVRVIGILPLSYSFITMSVPVGCFIMSITLMFRFKEKIALLRSS